MGVADMWHRIGVRGGGRNSLASGSPGVRGVSYLTLFIDRPNIPTATKDGNLMSSV